jgi:ubiquinone biosynthesis protein COQ9
MDDARIRQDIIFPLLEVLRRHAFDWEAVQEASKSTEHAYGIVRLAFSDSLDRVLKEITSYLGASIEEGLKTEDLSLLRTPEKIRHIFKITLIVLIPHKEALCSLTQHKVFMTQFPTVFSTGYQSMDAVWHKAGDRSTDYNFYTKRLLLSIVCVPTFLFWLRSENDLEESMEFFDKRLAQVMKIPKMKTQALDAVKSIFHNLGCRPSTGGDSGD